MKLFTKNCFCVYHVRVMCFAALQGSLKICKKASFQISLVGTTNIYVLLVWYFLVNWESQTLFLCTSHLFMKFSGPSYHCFGNLFLLLQEMRVRSIWEIYQSQAL